MNNPKAELRPRLKQKRLDLSSDQRAKFSQLINKTLETITPWTEVKRLHCFEPLLELGEVDISGFIEYLRSSYLGLELMTSRKLAGSWQVVTLDNQLVEKPYFDVVIVPMLGFDSSLQRLGNGGGYYDKLLATQPQVLKIGVCFEVGKTQHIPKDPHDIAMDVVVSEEQIYR